MSLLNKIYECYECFCIASLDNFAQTYLDCTSSIGATNVTTEGTMGYTVGMQQVVDVHTLWRNAFPEINLTTTPVAVEHDTVVVQWGGEAVNYGDFMGLSATNKVATFSGIAIYKFQNGKIVHQKNLFNALEIAQQLGWHQIPGLLPDNVQVAVSKHRELLQKLRFFYKNNNIALTKREVEILSFWVNGRSAKEIGLFFDLSYRTVQAYIANIMAKLQCHSKKALFDIVHDHNILHLFREFYDLCIMSSKCHYP